MWFFTINKSGRELYTAVQRMLVDGNIYYAAQVMDAKVTKTWWSQYVLKN
jgi:hypothetical protein